jgi:hypothetical protein
MYSKLHIYICSKKENMNQFKQDGVKSLGEQNGHPSLTNFVKEGYPNNHPIK